MSVTYAIAVGLLVASHLLTVSFFSEHPTDFAMFYMSAQYFMEGTGIYSPVPIDALSGLPDSSKATRDTLHPNLNPPFQTLFLAPLGLLDYRTAFWIFSSLSLVSGILGVMLIERATRKSRGNATRMLGFFVLFLAYFPTWVTIAYGQFGLFLLLLLAIAWVAPRSGKDEIAGIALGLALSIKLFIGLFLIFFLVRRRWKLLSWFAGTFLGCGVAALLVAGIDPYRQYMSVLSSVTWYSASWNASFMGFFTRMFGGSENTPLVNIPELAHALAYGSSLLVALCLIRLAWPRADGASPARFDLGFSLTITSMLLISPLGGMYYFPALILPVIVAWRLSDTLSSANGYKAMIMLAWVMSSIPSLLKPASEMNGPIACFMRGGIYFYALLIFSGILLVLAHRPNRN